MAFPNDGKKFQKGKSGNPNGRPKKLPELDIILAEVLSEEKDGISAAKAIIMKWRNEAIKGNLKAGELLMNRGWGLPKQNVDMKVSEIKTTITGIDPPEDQDTETDEGN